MGSESEIAWFASFLPELFLKLSPALLACATPVIKAILHRLP